VGGLALCFDGAVLFCFLLGGDLEEELAEWVQVFGHAAGHGELDSVVDDDGDSAEDRVAALVCLGWVGLEEGVRDGSVGLRGGVSHLGLRCWLGLCCCTT
jgi:hypothetical protein